MSNTKIRKEQIKDNEFAAYSHTHTESDITDLNHHDVNAIHSNVANEINNLTEKTTLSNNDTLVVEDSDDNNNKKKVTKQNLVAQVGNAQTVNGYAVDDSLTDNDVPFVWGNTFTSSPNLTFNGTVLNVNEVDLGSGGIKSNQGNAGINKVMELLKSDSTRCRLTFENGILVKYEDL